MICLHQAKTRHVHIQIHLFLDGRITGAQGFDFRVGQRGLVDIFTGTNRAFAGHDLADELLLILYCLPEVAVEGSLCGITIDLHIRIHVALTDDTTGALLQITGTPGTVQIMQGNQPILTVGACAHLGRAAEQNTHLTGAHLGKQLLLFNFCIGVMNKGDLFGRYTTGDQLAADILIHVEIALDRVTGYSGQLRQIIDRLQWRHLIIFLRSIRGFLLRLLRSSPFHALGRAYITEDQLRQPIFYTVLPDTEDVIDASIDLTAGIIRQHRIDQALIQTQLPSIAGNFQHVIDPRIDTTGVNLPGAFGKALHHGLLYLCGLHNNCLVVRCRRRQIQLIGSFNIRHFLKHGHQLRKVEELAEPGACPIARPLRSQLNRRGGFTEGGSPGVEVGHVVPLQRAVLQITLHGVHFRHTVADGCAGGKDHAAPAGQLIHVTAFQEHVRGLLCFRCGKARDIAHFRRQEEVFVGVRFVHKEPIHAQLLECDHIILPLFRLKLPQTAFQLLPGTLHLLDGKLLTPHEFQFLNPLGDLLDLLLQEPFLPRL